MALYAFISGYGIERSLMESHSMIKMYQKVIKYILRFLKRYWIVFVVFIPLGFLLGKLGKFDLKIFILSVIGLSKRYNIEWWYVKQYVFMLLISPCIIHLLNCFQKKNTKIVLCLVFLFYILYVGLCEMTKGSAINQVIIHSVFLYTLIYIEGIIISKYKVYERLRVYLKNTNGTMLGAALVSFSIALRVMWSNKASDAYFDVIVAPLFILGCCTVEEHISKCATTVLKWLGKYSIYMWLVHTFYCYYYFKELIYSHGYSFVIYIELVAISLIIAMIFKEIEKRVDYIFEYVKGNKLYGTD